MSRARVSSGSGSSRPDPGAAWQRTTVRPDDPSARTCTATARPSRRVNRSADAMAACCASGTTVPVGHGLVSMTMGVTHHGRTERLDLADPTMREWSCTVVASDPEAGIVLDRSAFYPGGGGQPPDHGVLLWQGVQTRILGTRKGDDLHLI